MKLNLRHRTRKALSASKAPALIESLEARQLLTTVPTILTPTGTVDTATPQITWDAVDNAVSYDFWATSLESFETVLVQRNIAGTNFTPSTDLSLGKVRMWVRANLADGTTSPWSPSQEIIVQSSPIVTGPTGPGAISLVTDSTPTIQWTSGDGARFFQVWVTDVTTGTGKQFNVENLTPQLDANGDEVTDSEGNVILEEIRSFEIPDADELQIGRYRVWVRSFDASNRISAWSQVYQFNVGPEPTNLQPTAPTFQTAPLLTWDAIDRADQYEVFVAAHPFDTPAPAGGNFTPIYREVVGPISETVTDITSFQIPENLAAGGYVFWVRAISTPENAPAVFGSWSDPAQFSTLRPVEITGPTLTGGVVTDSRPLIEWTRIDGAAAYEIELHRRNARPPYLNTLANGLSYRLENPIPAGDYTLWVRPIDTRGEGGPWSTPYAFTANGGRPVVTSPTNGEVTLLPNIQWNPVTDSDTVGYEYWVAHAGVQFQLYNADVLITDTDPATSFQVPDPLVDGGQYRVWVRAIFADTTRGPWSTPVDFTGGITVQNESETDVDVQLVSVEALPQTEARPTETWRPASTPPAGFDVAETEQPEAIPAPTEIAEAAAAKPASEGENILAAAAAECVETEWWTA